MIVRELIETEEDLIRDMQFVQRTYIRQSESTITPKEIKAVKDDVFGCFKDLLSLHNDLLLKNFNNQSRDPSTLGSVFVRYSEQLEDHNKYNKGLVKALEILDENSDVSEFYNVSRRFIKSFFGKYLHAFPTQTRTIPPKYGTKKVYPIISR